MAEHDYSKYGAPEKWKNSRLCGRDSRWLPVIQAEVTKPWIGITDGGTWVVEMPSGDVTELADSSLLALFPFLVKTKADFTRDLRESLLRNGLPAATAQDFPIKKAVCSALKSDSEYWQGLALNWVAPGNVEPEFREPLDFLVKFGRNQKNRHQAQMLLARGPS